MLRFSLPRSAALSRLLHRVFSEKKRNATLCPRIGLLRGIASALVAGAVLLPGAQSFASDGYRTLNVPIQWRFDTLSPAYNPENGEKLGEFQPGIRVQVTDFDVTTNKWKVRYIRYGSPDIEALIDWPSLANSQPHRWRQTKEELSGMPLLDKLLGSETPWPASLKEILKAYFEPHPLFAEAGDPTNPTRVRTSNGELGTAWGVRPLHVATEIGADGNPVIHIEVWNKTDGPAVRHTFPSNSVNNAYALLRDKLESLSRAMDGDTLRDISDNDKVLSLVREQRQIYPLCNRTQALLRYQRGEYLILELRPLNPPPLPTAAPDATAAATVAKQQPLSERLKANITVHEDGYRYLSGIPMINQGDKGYCVAASIARVMQYYGHHVDMHQMARLAGTEGYGTRLPDMLQAMRRISGSTPYTFRTIKTRNRTDLAKLSIERGMPLIWLIPGHARLLIGIDPEGGVVYSDSWGVGHDFKTMPWSDFLQNTVELFLIDVGDS